MAKRNKGATEEVTRERTRKEERLHARDREQHRKLYLGVSIAIGVALLFVAIGLVYQFAIRPSQAVATVGDNTIVARDFEKRVRLENSNLQGQLIRYQQLEEQFGNQGFFTNQINQLQATLASPFALGQQTLDQMIEEIIVERDAAARGLTVSDEEVNQALREEVANGLNLVTEPQATATAEAAMQATAIAAGWTPTPEPTIDANAALTPTLTPAPPPTRAVISDTAYSEGLSTLEQNVDNVANMSIDEYKAVIRARLLRDKLAQAIGEEQVTGVEEQVKARHILLREIEPTAAATAPLTATTGLTATASVTESNAVPVTSEVTGTASLTGTQSVTTTATLETNGRTREQAFALANELRQRILAGEDFATLAAEYSDDPGSKVNGGDLGWFGRGAMVAPFEDAAFALPVGEISEPISTTFGVHLIQVDEKDSNRPKDASQVDQERAQAFQTWLQEQITAANVERNDIMGNLPSEFR